MLEDRSAACADGLVGAKNEGEGADHEHYGAPGGGAGEGVGGAARTERGLAAGPAERAGEVSRFAALQ